MASRVAGGILRSLFSGSELEDDFSVLLVVHSVKEYEDIVVRLVGNQVKSSVLAHIRGQIARRTLVASIFDSRAMQTYVERAYEGAWDVRSGEGVTTTSNTFPTVSTNLSFS